MTGFMMRPTAMLVFLLVLAPASAVAQAPGNETAEERIEAALDRASEAGIPTSLLESKVREGSAKGVPMDRIADAVQRRLDGLVNAREALSGVADVGPGDLEVGADALESGVSGAVLAELAETAPGERRTAAIAALSYLVGAEVAPQEALDRVQEALARGPEALQNLPAQARGRGPAGAPGNRVGPPEGTPEPNGVGSDVGPPGGVPAPGERPGGGRPGGDIPPDGVPPSDRPGPPGQ